MFARSGFHKSKKEHVISDWWKFMESPRIATVLSIGEECVQEEELQKLLQSKEEPIAYDGFEPSGRMHIAQGIMRAINVNKLTSNGIRMIFWVADWFALMNNKMGGNLEHIRDVGRYMIHVWRAVGMDMSRVEFRWSSEEINKHANEYWTLVMDIARQFNLTRIKRCSTIMGREASDEMPSAQILYPCMQCADIFFLKADICQLGMDQRKVNMLAREYCDAKKIKQKPIVLSHHMLMGLTGKKMAKSDPKSAIFMEDSEAEVNAKIRSAFCAPGDIETNPCLDYVRYIVFPKFGTFTTDSHTYHTIDEVIADYKTNKLHPKDLKNALAIAINKCIQPVRDHFQNDPKAKALLARIKTFAITK